uniref:POU domain protein n=1 Tax=Timema tahoe TaxID=61484 RepID=A0A7R9IHM4_9NEOP|nr:unnamed protein product [Timema tahoe]
MSRSTDKDEIISSRAELRKQIALISCDWFRPRHVMTFMLLFFADRRESGKLFGENHPQFTWSEFEFRPYRQLKTRPNMFNDFARVFTVAGMVTLQNLQNLATLQSLPQVASLAAGLQGIAGLGTQLINTPLNLSASATKCQIQQNHSPIVSYPILPSSTQSRGEIKNSQLALDPLPLFEKREDRKGHLVLNHPLSHLREDIKSDLSQIRPPLPLEAGVRSETKGALYGYIVTRYSITLLCPVAGPVVWWSLHLDTSLGVTGPIPGWYLGYSSRKGNYPIGNLSCPASSAHTVGNLLGSASQPQLLAAPQPAAMPQFILASGQLVQGIQGAQLLIPTSQGKYLEESPMERQGIATQTILTIPVNHVTSGQMVNLALSNGQVVTTTLANLQTLAQPHHLLTPPSAIPEKHHPNGVMMNGSESSISAINRLAANNSDITITSTHPAPQNLHKSSLSVHTSSNGSSQHNRSSPPVDFLADSPNQPTINQTNSNVVDGINLDEIKEFAKAFKLRRLSLGLTQTQVGQALSITEGPAYSQSAICRFEKLDITPKSAQKIKPVLEMWMKEAEERYKSGQNHLTEFIGVEPSKKRKRRTSFTPQALELLNAHFERNTHPSGTEITALAHQLGYEREVIRIWFCNKRQALKNTVRMMSKGVA